MTQVLSGTPDALVGEAADRPAVVAAEAAAVAAAAPVTGIATAAVNAASAASARASAEAAQTAAEASAGATHAAVRAAARAGRPGAKAPAKANLAVAAAEADGVAGTAAKQPTGAQTSPAAAGVVTRPEFAVFLADPMLPHFDPGVQPGAAVSLASPAEQGLWRDISLAQRIRTQLHQSEAGFEAVFAGAPAPLLVAALVA